MDDSSLPPTQLIFKDENTSNHALVSEALEKYFSGSTQDIVAFVNLLLEDSVRLGASDLLCEPEKETINIRIRIDGVLYLLGTIDTSTYDRVIARIKILSKLDTAERRKVQEGQFSVVINDYSVNFRVEIVQTINGEMIVIRILQRTTIIMEISQLGFSKQQLQAIKDIIQFRSGLVLVCGPTGSGKTTTLYSTIAMLNKSKEYNIVTIEDPVEYQLEGINQMQVREDLGFSFQEGLKVTLRLTPDIILVGEIRDGETARIAVESGLTGHMVLSTIHAPDSVGVIYRLLELGVHTYLFNTSLRGIIAQRLVRKNCPHCTKPYQPTSEEIDLFKKTLGQVPKQLYRGQGCPDCQNLGYKGRVGIYEVLQIDARTRSLIRQETSEDKLRETLQEYGFITLIRDGLLKCEQGITTTNEVLRNSLRIA